MSTLHDPLTATGEASAWPLSIPATAVLRTPKLTGEDALKLALKELVVRRTWSLESRPVGLLRRRRPHFAPGVAAAPGLPPLLRADAALRSVVGSNGREVSETVGMMLDEDRRLPKRVRDDARAELAQTGLIVLENRKVLGLVPRTVVERTPAGDAWVEESKRAAGSSLSTLALIDESFKRRRDRDAGTSGYADGCTADLGTPPDLDLLDALDGGFDSAFDDGVSDADGDTD